LLDRFVEALGSGDAGAVGALLTADHCAAVRVDGDTRIRVTAVDGETAADGLVALFAGADDLTLSGRIATEWYVFAEYLARFDAAGHLRRVAAMHPVRDGKLEGTFGYGLDEPLGEPLDE